MPDLVGWYRQAKSSTHGLTGEEKTPHWEGLSRQGYRFHHASGTHDGTTLGLGGHKIAMEDDPNATPEVLMKALEDTDWRVRANAAIHPNATAEVLMKALEDTDWRVRANAAIHPNATAEVLMKALEDFTDLPWQAASHPNATAEVLMKALGNERPLVREEAAGHRNATAEVLMKALEDGYDGVRVAAASNRNATTEVLMKASKDDSTTVRWTAVRHPNATVGMKAEWVINVLKSRSEGELSLFFQDLGFHRGEFIMSDLIRLIITDKRVDLGGLDMFQKALEERHFDNPIVSRMIKREKMWRKTDA